MKALSFVNLKQFGFMGTALVMGLGIYNSMVINSTEFMNNAQNIVAFKRLDEVNGQIKLGKRDIAQFKPIEEVKEVPAQVVAQEPKREIETPKVEEEIERAAEPAIVEDLNLELTAAFHNGPIQGEVRGSATTIDGLIEEIYIQLPNGQEIYISTNERMEGNVFRYLDAETGEGRSGMFYEVKKGTYMITLANDTNYSGARFEFKAPEEVEVNYGASQEGQAAWNIDGQNENQEENTNAQVESNDQQEQEENTDGASNNYSFQF